MAKAARRIPMTVTFLEMNAKPRNPPPPQPRGKIAFLKCDRPPTHFYRYLYDTVGGGLLHAGHRRLQVGHDQRPAETAGGIRHHGSQGGTVAHVQVPVIGAGEGQGSQGHGGSIHRAKG